MVNEVSAVQFRQNIGDMLNQVQYRQDSVIIHRDGKPVAALISIDQFAELRRRKARARELRQMLADAYAGVPMEEGLAEIDAAVAAARGKQHRSE